MAICSVCGTERPDEDFVLHFRLNNEAAHICPNCFNEAQKMLLKHIANGNQEALDKAKELGIDVSNIENILANKALAESENHLKSFNIEEETKKMYKTAIKNSPKKLKKFLDEYVIGQDNAKKTLSMAIYNHYKRATFDMGVKSGQIDVSSADMPDELSKSNILLAGPSGCGKTLIVKTLAKRLGIPAVIVDSSAYTEHGFVGPDPENAIRDLYIEAGENINKAQYGIIFFDEFDKLARKSGDSGMITSDPGREGVQQSILKIIEGGKVSFTMNGQRIHPDAPMLEMDTTNILFICGGAFEGIEKIIEKRVSSATMGFNLLVSDPDKINTDNMDETEKYNTFIDKVAVEDFKEYGIITEVLGRLPLICKIHQLTEDELCKILTEPKNALIKQYKTINKIIDHISIDFTDEAIKSIAKKVIKMKTGARGLRTAIEEKLSNVIYDISDKTNDNNISITITDKFIENDDTLPEIKITPKAA